MMNLGEVIKTAWKSLLSNKLRSLLTMLGVIIGVAAVIVMISISAGTEATIAEAINGLGSNLVFISGSMSLAGRVPECNPQVGLVYDDVTAIKEKINGVAGVTVEQPPLPPLNLMAIRLEEITVVGSTPDYPTVRDMKVAEGRFYNTRELDRISKVVVLGKDVADQLFGETDPIGQTIIVNTSS